jgi:hypothetical protein
MHKYNEKLDEKTSPYLIFKDSSTSQVLDLLSRGHQFESHKP